MATPIAVIISFHGDPDDLLQRFERARRRWIAAQERGYERPAFHAACRRDEGLVIVSGWKSAAAHRVFGQTIAPYLEAENMQRPDEIERMQIERLGWH